MKIKFERNKWIPYHLVSQSTVQLIRWGRNSYRYEPGKCNNLSHGNLMKIQSFIKKNKKIKKKIPCLSASVSGLVVGKGIQS